MIVDLQTLLSWALETNATQGDIENELAYHGLNIGLFDFLDMLEELKTECVQ